MADRNLTVAHRGGIYTTRDGMELHVPPSGFDFRTAAGVGVNIDPFTDDNALQQYPIGTGLVYGSRKFRYALIGGSSLSFGQVIGAKAVIAGHTDETVVMTAAATTALFTPSATAITANEYRDGFLSILSGTGRGMYQVLNHLAEATGSAQFTLNLIDPIVVTGASTPKGTLIQNPYGEVIATAVTTRIGQPVGVAQGIVTNAQFGWVQTHGPAAVLFIGTSVVGDDVVVPTGTTAGSAGPRTTALAVKETVIGRAMEVTTTNGDTIQVFLTIE